MMNRRQFLIAAAGVAAGVRRAGASDSDDALLEDIQKRALRYFVEQSDPRTGIVRSTARSDGGDAPPNRWSNGSLAVTGFGLAVWCVAAERGWMPRSEARDRVSRCLAFFADHVPEVHGWCYHWLDLTTGARRAAVGPEGPGIDSEISTVDKAFFLAGALTAREYFSEDAGIRRHTETLYSRVDFPWMLAPNRLVFRHGWTPEGGFIPSFWDTYSEAGILYLLGIGSPAHPVAAQTWFAWKRPETTYGGYRFIGDQALFTYQYSHAFVDFRGKRDHRGIGPDWFKNSQIATQAHRQFCIDLAHDFPGCYSPGIWGITTSDSRKGYVSWGGPPREPNIDGTVVPAAAGGSLMFCPDLCVPALRTMRDRFGARIYSRYGFCNAFHPTNGWTSPTVQGLDQGMTLLSAENLRSGKVWKWFTGAPEIIRAFSHIEM